MSAVEEIEAAIEKLTHQRKVGDGLAWEQINHVPGESWDGITYCDIAEVTDDGELIVGMLPVEHADLIVTLHRTIAMQIVILGVAKRAYVHFERTGSGPLDADRATLMLARAINGTS